MCTRLTSPCPSPPGSGEYVDSLDDGVAVILYPRRQPPESSGRARRNARFRHHRLHQRAASRVGQRYRWRRSACSVGQFRRRQQHFQQRHRWQQQRWSRRASSCGGELPAGDRVAVHACRRTARDCLQLPRQQPVRRRDCPPSHARKEDGGWGRWSERESRRSIESWLSHNYGSQQKSRGGSRGNPKSPSEIDWRHGS